MARPRGVQARRRARGRGRGHAPRTTIPLMVIVAVAIAGLALTAVVWGGGETPPAAVGGDAGVSHVHGLGINPGDGALFAATHSGLFRIPDRGPARRIADRYQDTMGFTVVGDDRFLGSGHPDINEPTLRNPGRPPLLGLIESKDGGETWKPLSLLGEADFHALVAAHDRVYGFDATSGRFMVSGDTRTWETRSTLQIFSFAVDPKNAESVVATTAGGIVESGDGGRSWKRSDGPQLLVVSWDDGSALWGAGEDGSVYRRDADGTWDKAGSVPGEPQALLARGGRIYSAAADADGVTGIYTSADGSAWKLLYRDGDA